MIRVLRPIGESSLISARVFEDSFARSLFPNIAVESIPLAPWLDSILSLRRARLDPLAEARAFHDCTAAYHFLCPDHVAIPLSPFLLEMRNRSCAPIRLLLIAHAPGVYVLEWALIRPLLQPGDVIVAPTRSAAKVIEFLSPELAAYTYIIPHPIRPLPRCGQLERRSHIVSLTRLHPDKLLHRQIEAMAVLRDRGYSDTQMRIAGPLSAPDTRDWSPYVRALAAKVRRLGLQDRVELVSQIDSPAEKSQFLAGARLLVNLSVTAEESFGKSVAEALGCGVPALVTHWNGLPETVGAGGACVPVDATNFGMDVSAERVADGIALLLQGPPDRKTCRSEAARFHPRRVRYIYREVLNKALQNARPGGPTSDDLWNLSSAPAEGLLSVTAPLTRYSWGDLFVLHAEFARYGESSAGRASRNTCEAASIRMLLLFGVQAPLCRFLAGLPTAGTERPVGFAHELTAGDGPSADKISVAALSKATLNSRLTCLSRLATYGKRHELRAGVDALRSEGLRSWAIDYMEIEALRLEQQYQRAFGLSIGQKDPLAWGELASERLRQLAAVCRDWGFPGLALPWLRDWLERFPDSPDSAMVHLDRAANAIALGLEFREEAESALKAARLLLGESTDLLAIQSEVDRVERKMSSPPWSAIAENLGAISDVEQIGSSSFVAVTDVGKVVVKRVGAWRPAHRYFELLMRVSQASPQCYCPRPLGAVMEDATSGYLISEWVEGVSVSEEQTDDTVWHLALNLLRCLQNHVVVPEWPLESLWLDLLEENLQEEEAALSVLNSLRRVLPSGARTLAHGDFAPQNMVHGTNGIMLVDWEEVGSAPAGFDAGWMLAHARLGAGMRGHRETWLALLAAGFAPANLTWFESLGLVRLLFRARTLPMDEDRRRSVIAAVRNAVLECAEDQPTKGASGRWAAL